jgi:hypothetical protein
MTYDEITARYRSLRDRAKNRREALSAKSTKARRDAIRHQAIAARKMTEYHRLETMNHETTFVSWIKELVIPLVLEVNRIMGETFDTSDLRSYGLRCNCPVFSKNMHLNFTPGEDDGDYLYVDTGEIDPSVDPDSIAGRNGFQNHREPVKNVQTVIDNLARRYPDKFKK